MKRVNDTIGNDSAEIVRFAAQCSPTIYICAINAEGMDLSVVDLKYVTFGIYRALNRIAGV